MSTHIALLRGINVGGHAMIKMDELRALFERLGLTDVRTYVQSGNVIFKCGKSPKDLSRSIGDKIRSTFGLDVFVILLSPETMGRVIQKNPFLKEKGIDQSKLHVTFLSAAPDRKLLERLNALVRGRDQFRIGGEEIYLYCPDGYGVSKLSNNAFEKLLSLRATTRNWNSVNKIYAMSLE